MTGGVIHRHHGDGSLTPMPRHLLLRRRRLPAAGDSQSKIEVTVGHDTSCLTPTHLARHHHRQSRPVTSCLILLFTTP